MSTSTTPAPIVNIPQEAFLDLKSSAPESWKPSFGIPISAIRPSMNSIEMECIIVRALGSTIGANETTFYNFIVADQSGSINLCLVGAAGAAFKESQIVRVSGGRARMYRDQISIYVRKDGGRLVRTGEFRMLFSLEPQISECDWAQQKVKGEWLPLQKGMARQLRQLQQESPIQPEQQIQLQNQYQQPAHQLQAQNLFGTSVNHQQYAVQFQPQVTTDRQFIQLQLSVMSEELQNTLIQVITQLAQIKQQPTLTPEMAQVQQALLEQVRHHYNEVLSGRLITGNNVLIDAMREILSLYASVQEASQVQQEILQEDDKPATSVEASSLIQIQDKKLQNQPKQKKNKGRGGGNQRTNSRGRGGGQRGNHRGRSQSVPDIQPPQIKRTRTSYADL